MLVSLEAHLKYRRQEITYPMLQDQLRALTIWYPRIWLRQVLLQR